MQISGSFDPTTLVDQLMQLERQPLTALQTRKTAATTAADAISKIRSQVDAYRLAAAKLAETSNFARYKATTSGSGVVASVTGDANIGSLSFTVDRLAQSHGLRSVGTVATDTTTITTATALSLATGTRAIGIDTVRAGSGLGAGTAAVEVTQASAGATVAGTTVATSTVVDGSNDTFTLDVNGAARVVTIAAGTYDRDQLTAAVQSALDASGGGVDVALDASGALALTTTREGSAASIQLTGGTALASLGLSVDATAHLGTDGIVDVGGTVTTITLAEAGQSIAIDTGAGIIDATLSGGLRTGERTVTTVSTGSRSLADVAAAINGANAGMSAAAVKVGDGAWRLQLSSRSTGTAGRLAIDDTAFTGIGGLVESSAAQDAAITIGSGPGAYQVESTTNSFSQVLGGVSLSVNAVSTAPVTVDVNRNDDAIATDIANLVGAANTLLAEIKVQTRFDSTTRTSGALAGNGAIRRLAEQVRSALAGQVSGLSSSATNGLSSSVGVQLGKDGSFSFDKAKFTAAVAGDPGAIARLFGRGGSGTGGIEFAGAADATRPGTYDVEITTAATRATSATIFGSGTTATRLGVRVGSTTATVDVTAGQSVGQVIDALNASFARAGIAVAAEVDGTGLRVVAQSWGSAGDFEINTDVAGVGTWDATAGTDVAGTIDGKVAVGSGRRLSIPPIGSDAVVGLQIDVPGGATGSLGTITYEPGIAARVVQFGTALTDADTGSLTSAKEAADRRIKDFTDQMTRLEDRLTIREVNLRRQYSNLQTLLGNLEGQGTALSGAISGLGTMWQQ